MTRLRSDFIGATAGSSARREGPHPAEADHKGIPPRINAGFPAKANDFKTGQLSPFTETLSFCFNAFSVLGKRVWRLAPGRYS
jgi:hypothetical protein